MTVQLGAGFVVGCVIGVIIYGATRVGLRLMQGRVTPRTERRTRRRGREMGEAVLLEV